MVRIDSIAPDVAFSDVAVIPGEELEIEEKIGEGGFGVVFKVFFFFYFFFYFLSFFWINIFFFRASSHSRTNTTKKLLLRESIIAMKHPFPQRKWQRNLMNLNEKCTSCLLSATHVLSG